MGDGIGQEFMQNHFPGFNCDWMTIPADEWRNIKTKLTAMKTCIDKADIRVSGSVRYTKHEMINRMCINYLNEKLERHDSRTKARKKYSRYSKFPTVHSLRRVDYDETSRTTITCNYTGSEEHAQKVTEICGANALNPE